MGPLHTRRCKGFIPTSCKRTTRLPNGGSFVFILVPASQPHRRLLSAAVKTPHRPNGLSTEVILREAISTGSPLSGKLFVGGICLPIAESKRLCSKIVEKVKPQKPPPSERKRSLGGGVMKSNAQGEAFAPSCAQMPLSPGGVPRDLPAGRSLGAVSFACFFAEAKKWASKKQSLF